MGESENRLDHDSPLRSDPQRGDWLSNVWLYIKSVERLVLELEERVIKLERGHKDSHSIHFDSSQTRPPLDED